MKILDILYCNCGSNKPVKGSVKPRPKPMGGNSNGTNGTKRKNQSA